MSNFRIRKINDNHVPKIPNQDLSPVFVSHGFAVFFFEIFHVALSVAIPSSFTSGDHTSGGGLQSGGGTPCVVMWNIPREHIMVI